MSRYKEAYVLETIAFVDSLVNVNPGAPTPRPAVPACYTARYTARPAEIHAARQALSGS